MINPSGPERSRPPRTAWIILVIVVGVVIAGGWFTWPAGPSAHPAASPPAPAPAGSAPSPTASFPEPGPAPTNPPIVGRPRALPASNAFTTLEDYRQRQASAPRQVEPLIPPPAGRTPETELGQVGFAVRDFRAAFGSNPVGSNREITRALLGDNARGVKILAPGTASLNARGELLDSWGRPYFFHALSGAVMEIRSAGADGKIFTADDLVQ